MKHTQGGTFDPHEKFVYFIASNPSVLHDVSEVHQHILVGINEIKNQASVDLVKSWCDDGIKVFLDSGIFNLTMTHARAHNTTMNEALLLAPEEIDGFDALFERYVRLIGILGDACWGYTELDQGGREAKIRMRARLEGMGLRPIPVYHPLGDGVDYFDELASQYDRIAFGNVVQASPPCRIRLMATAWERRRRYPHLWVHLLGVTPSSLTMAFPPNSCDSSSWLSGVRWGRSFETAMTRPVGDLSSELIPIIGHDDNSAQTALGRALGARQAGFLQANTRLSLAALGAEL